MENLNNLRNLDFLKSLFQKNIKNKKCLFLIDGGEEQVEKTLTTGGQTTSSEETETDQVAYVKMCKIFRIQQALDRQTCLQILEKEEAEE